MVKPSHEARDSEPSDGILPTTEEQSSSEGSLQKLRSCWQSTLSHLKAEVSLDHADVPIIACCYVSGLCDSSSFNAWGCFVSMQTGTSLFSPFAAERTTTDCVPRKYHLPRPQCLQPTSRRPLQLGQIPHRHRMLLPRILRLLQYATHTPQSTRQPRCILPRPKQLHNCGRGSRANTRCPRTLWVCAPFN